MRTNGRVKSMPKVIAFTRLYLIGSRVLDEPRNDREANKKSKMIIVFT